MTDDITRLNALAGDAAASSVGASGAPRSRREALAAEGHRTRRAARDAERATQRSGLIRRANATPPVLRPEPGTVVAAPAVPRATAAHRAPLRKRVARKVFPPVVMAAAAALVVGMSVPPAVLIDPDAPAATASLGTEASALAAGAVIETSESAVEPVEAEPSQVLVAEASDDEAQPVAARDDWTVTSYAEVLRERYGNRSFAYATTGAGAVQWPFPFAAEISSGFGARLAPCYGCSSYHQGLDFVPGYGTPIQAIADGTVTFAGWGGGFGQHVIIEHVINGQRVQSLYAHMVGESTPLVAGEAIAAGDFVGLVGSTGVSTAPHLHFELHLDGVPVDPFAWLTTNAS